MTAPREPGADRLETLDPEALRRHQWARLSALGLARVEERYSWTSVAAATVTAYETAIRKTRTATQNKRNARADR